METRFIAAKYEGKISLGKEVIGKLPLKTGLASPIQFIGQLGMIKKEIESIKNKVDAFLYVGDGEFHPLAIALKINKPVYQYNPLNKEFKKISEEEINKIKKNKKISYVKFLHADNVGIIISTKPGQYYPIEKAEQLKKKYKNKKFYTFICDNVDEREFENFNFIQACVNTAFPRIKGKNIMNIEEI